MKPAWAMALLLLAPAALAQESTPRRVVSLAPSLTAMVVSLGAADRLAAVTPFCEAPPEVPRLAGGLLADAESVLGLAPDLVLATPMTPEPTRRQLVSLGLKVELVEAGSLAAIRRSMAALARTLGVGDPQLAPPAPRPPQASAALLFGTEGGYSAGRGTYAHDILEAAGLRNIAADRGPWPELGEEYLLAADPDVLLIADYGRSSREEVLRALRADAVRSHLRAVREGRVFVLPATTFSVPGPEALDEPERLREQLALP